jgi:hypothetical protein
MKSIRTLALGLVSIVFLVAGCAHRPPQEAATETRDCVYIHQINAYETIDDQHLVVKISAARYHLVTVDRGCPGLSVSRYALVQEPWTRICGDGFSFMKFEHPTIGLTRCRILEMEPVESPDAARERVELSQGG